MARADQLTSEMHRLLAALLDEQLDTAGEVRLVRLLAEEPEARGFYVQYMKLQALLFRDHADPPAFAAPPAPKQVLSSPPVMALGLLGRGVQYLSHPLRFSLLVASVTLASVLLTAVQFPARAPRPAPTDASASAANSPARVVRQVAAEWRRPPAANGKLAAGEPIALVSGLVEVQFQSGARIVLEGPVDFVATSAGSGYLQSGRLAVEVPPPAQGFTIETPQAEIIDRGTQFGVSVDEQGTAEVHVFQGSVEIVARQAGAAPARLPAGAAARIAPSGQVVVEAEGADAERFTRTLPAEPTTVTDRPAIGVDFLRGFHEPRNSGFALAPDAVAGLVPQTNWNTGSFENNPLGGQGKALVHDATGRPLPGVRIAWFAGKEVVDTGTVLHAVPRTSNERLMRDHFTGWPDGAGISVSVEGLPEEFTQHGFDLILYVDARNDPLTDVDHQFLLDLEQDGTPDHTAHLPSTARRDYLDRGHRNDFEGYSLRFDRVGRGGSGAFQLTVAGVPDHRVVLSGMQIVARENDTGPTSPSPEE